MTILGVRLFFIEGRVNCQEVRNFAKSQATNVIVLNKESHQILFQKIVSEWLKQNMIQTDDNASQKDNELEKSSTSTDF